MVETTILSLPIKSIECLDTRDRNKNSDQTAGSLVHFYSDHVYTFPTPMPCDDWPVVKSSA